MTTDEEENERGPPPSMTSSASAETSNKKDSSFEVGRDFDASLVIFDTETLYLKIAKQKYVTQST
jgi:hypothetical protein